MSKTNLIWWAIAGVLLSLLVGVTGALLALGDGSSVAGSVMIGAGAAGGAAGLWIAGTAAVHSALKRDRGGRPEA
ncbi:hypothetical protein [Planomonospora sp. ID82291]|uniref:hypothetical protein n=1 Tax=Planomonospora sp. ID82291 TaxID=2738136 RepID=UPI0018C3A4D1|nr:hypothetical protein [Planomonospora sp. ID82291]MBG0813384.1 hypothetical protein [Planomonospora sp. ID82291]